MTERKYEYIMAIVNTGTLSKAAIALGVSQPALSQFLQKEEALVGSKIFQKIDNRMVLTYAGECYVEYTKKILALQNEMMTTLEDIARSEKGRIRIGIPTIRRPYTILSVIPAFREKYPDIDIMLTENNSSILEKMLEEMQLDVIAVDVAKYNQNFTYRQIAQEEIVLAVPADHPLVRQAKKTESRRYPAVKPEDLATHSFIFLPPGSRNREFAERILVTGKIECRTAMVAKTLESALEAVSVGLGITFTPEVPLSYIRNSRNLRYLSVESPHNQYDFDLVFRRNAYISPGLKDFSNIFIQNYHKEKSSYA